MQPTLNPNNASLFFFFHQGKGKTFFLIRDRKEDDFV